ncbi:hypothetical protein NEFER03_1910 [Nematocida sp. LUAm3]|nr:hypothetical protein NEFER03_1910 [Nematocida sp. LUAm3]KAI5176150.1 hypothetical protein NEFER02_1964 [Nematocida sp. LUAm2]KAI5179253.1 hypothetical protein NEFER01_2105 [Nematocida sp. LUAm1]
MDPKRISEEQQRKEQRLKEFQIEYYTVEDILTDTPKGRAIKKMYENNYI